MIQISQWKRVTILVLSVLAFIYAAPNLVPASMHTALQDLPGWLPTKTINLGLDLQGGSHLLLEVDMDEVLREHSENIVQSLRPALRSERIGYSRISPLTDGVRLTLRDIGDTDTAKKIIRENDATLDILTSEDGQTLEARIRRDALDELKKRVVSQSIEIIRRRVDETGTREPAIQRQGEDRIIVQLPGVDDPARVRELLGKTAKLSFHLVEDGSGARVAGSRSLPLLDQPGQSLTIARRALITGDMLTNAQPSFGQGGEAVVSFELNAIGARRFCQVTRENVNRPFAIVLDDEIVSAPNIREPICGGRGQISGNFTVQSANDLAVLLRAGALPAPLSVLEERTVGPSLGADSIAAGQVAAIVALVLVLAYMGLAYGLFGLFANIALLVNVAAIFALLSALQATLTLPGIAGIVLTIGMAVDANVLIFERIREEIRTGRSPLPSVDSGYGNAMSTIIDANMTTLIAAIILFSFGTGPIKGFAVTLAIGIVTSLFSAIMVTRLLVVSWLLKKRPATLTI